MAIAAIIYMFALVGIAGPTVAEAAENSSTNSDVLHVRVGKHDYAIPRGYISYVRRAADGRINYLGMRALWPGLEAKNSANARLWRRRIPKRQIYIVLQAETKDNAGFFIVAKRYNLQGEKYKYGLMHFKYLHLDIYADEKGKYISPVGTTVTISCLIPRKEAYQSFDISRTCEVEYPLCVGCEGVFYTFYLVNLSQWREIDAAVRHLILSMRVK